MSLLEPLPWDSDFFGVSIARATDGLAPVQIEQVAREADELGVDCTYLLMPAAEAELLDRAQEHGFRVRDVCVELRRGVAGHPASLQGLRRGTLQDLAGLGTIARERFVGTRFFADPRFSPERSGELYVAWLRKGLQGDEGWVCLVDQGSRGFVVCELRPDAELGAIALIAVAAEAAGRGLGGALLAGAGALFAEAALARASVVTQARNIAALRLYEANGYRTAETGIWLHRWRP